MSTLPKFPAKKSPIKECGIFAHSLAEHWMSQQGMLININTTNKDKNVPLRYRPHPFQDGVSLKICKYIFRILIQFDT